MPRGIESLSTTQFFHEFSHLAQGGSTHSLLVAKPDGQTVERNGSGRNPWRFGDALSQGGMETGGHSHWNFPVGIPTTCCHRCLTACYASSSLNCSPGCWKNAEEAPIQQTRTHPTSYLEIILRSHWDRCLPNQARSGMTQQTMTDTRMAHRYIVSVFTGSASTVRVFRRPIGA